MGINPRVHGFLRPLILVLVLLIILVLLRPSPDEASATSPNEVITTVLESTPLYPLHFLILATPVGLLVNVRSFAIRAEFASEAAAREPRHE